MYKYIAGIVIVMVIGYYSFYYFSKQNVTIINQSPELINTKEVNTEYQDTTIEDELFK